MRLSGCRPCEGRDPYSVPSRSAAAYGSRLGGSFAALAGTTPLLVLAAVAMLAAALPAFATEIPPAERRSDYEFMGPQTRAMQDDDTANPGMLWVLDGEALWNRRDGAAGKSCADCHGDARTSMKGVAARYPAFEPGARPPDRSRAAHQSVPHRRIRRRRRCRSRARSCWPHRLSRPAIARHADRRSRTMPRTQPFIAAGRELFNRRQGQLNLSCAQCHDDNWGQKLAGAPVPQGHPNGYPVYRLEWQSLGSLQRRLRNCMSGMRAEPYGYGSPENVDLELYLMWRASGLKLEAPAVRP